MPIRRPRTNNWPPHSHLIAYDFDYGDWGVFAETRNPKYDLSDNLSYMLNAGKSLRLGIEIEGNTNWPVWDANSLDWLEKRIIWDFAFDGDNVKLTRITPERVGLPCSEEFIWLVENTEDTTN